MDIPPNLPPDEAYTGLTNWTEYDPDGYTPVTEVIGQSADAHDDALAEVYAETPLENKLPFDVEKLGSIYYVHRSHRSDGRTLSGKDAYEAMPDSHIYIRQDVSYRDEVRQEFYKQLASTPNLNHEYPEVIDIVTGRLRADFPDSPERPLYIVNPENYHRLLPQARGSGGSFAHNHVLLLKADPENIQLFGINHLVHSGLHEGFHGTAVNGHAEYHSFADEKTISLVGLSGYDGYNPTIRESSHKIIEEGTADLYAVSRIESMGRAIEVRPNEFHRTSVYRYEAPVTFTHANNTPHIDPASLAPYVPVAYLAAAAVDEHNIIIPSRGAVNSDAALGAYGLALLDQAAPGLRQSLLEGRTNPDAAQAIPGYIDSIEPGLYKELGQAQYTSLGFLRALLRVHQALGIANASAALQQHDRLYGHLQ
jgi:hypothetical protein